MESGLSDNQALRRELSLHQQTEEEFARKVHVYQKTIKTLLANLNSMDAQKRAEIERHITAVLAPQGHAMLVTSRPDRSVEKPLSDVKRVRLLTLGPDAEEEEAEEDEVEAFGSARWSSRRRSGPARRRAEPVPEEAAGGPRSEGDAWSWMGFVSVQFACVGSWLGGFMASVPGVSAKAARGGYGLVGGAVDYFGSQALGDAWPVLCWTVMLGAVALGTAGVGYGLQSIVSAVKFLIIKPLWLLTWPLRCALGLCKCPTPAAPRDDEIPVPELRGPATRVAVDNEYYGKLRSSTRGRAHHLVVKVGDTSARLERPPHNSGMKPNRDGISWKYCAVLSSSSRRLTRLLEESEIKVIHLCRETPCLDTRAYTVHAPAYCCLEEDEDANLDALVAHTPPACLSARIMGSGASWCGKTCAFLGWRGGIKLCASFKRCGRGGYCPGRRSASDPPVELLRDPNSESESEPEELRCSAHDILYQDGDTIFQLTKTKCRDRARGDPLPLLAEDLEKSKLKKHQTAAPLCWVHRNMYYMERGAKKCARVGCTRVGRTLKSGVLLCVEHDQEQEKPTVAPRPEAPHPLLRVAPEVAVPSVRGASARSRSICM